jgi:hypothetical protein
MQNVALAGAVTDWLFGSEPHAGVASFTVKNTEFAMAPPVA